MKASAVQPWLYNPPPPPLPRSKPLEVPGDPLFLPPIDKMWGMQPSASPPTIEPPEKKGEVGLQATIPPQSLEGWYATIPPQMIEDGLVDNRTAYYVRCLGGPAPCPYTVPPAILRYWARVKPGETFALKASPAGADRMEVLANLGFAVGNDVIIDPLTPTQEIKKIKAFGSMIFDSPMQFAHAEGCVIKFMPSTTPLAMPMQPWAVFQPFGAWNIHTPFFPGPAPAPFPGPMGFMSPAPAAAWGALPLFVPPPAAAPWPAATAAWPAAGAPGPAAGAPGPAGAPGGAPSPAPVR